MTVYLVGGAVRDKLLGLESKDNDYVVVGSSMEEMLSLGYKQVGSNFPVFLHPETNEEYALARREKKTGSGYNGFSVEFGKDVTLEEDTSRRDLTINAMAMTSDGMLIDPHGGIKDLRNGILRHVSNAFAEDPLRVLRVARFAARYNFTVHPETVALCNQLVEAGELEHLTPERVWKEVSRMFTEKHFFKGYNFLMNDLVSPGKLLSNLFKNVEEVKSDRQLTPEENAYFYTTLSSQTDPVLLKCVSSGFVKDVQRFKALTDLKDFSEFKVFTNTFFDFLQNFIDANRSFLTQESYRTALKNFSELHNNIFLEFTNNLLKAADSVYRLNFTDILADTPKEDIKFVVKHTKYLAIKEIFQ